MGGLERGYDPFDRGKFVEGGKSIVISGVGVINPTDVLQEAMLGSDCGII